MSKHSIFDFERSRNQRQGSEFFKGGFLEINCKAYSISSVAEKKKASEFFQGGFLEINCKAYSISSVDKTRDRASNRLLREVEIMGWFPVACVTNGVFVVARGGIEIETHGLIFPMLDHYTTAPLRRRHCRHCICIEPSEEIWSIFQLLDTAHAVDEHFNTLMKDATAWL